MLWISLIVFVISVFVLFGYCSNYVLKVNEINVNTEYNLEGARIVQLSDLHGMCFGKKNEHLVEKVIKCRPEIILITGDMIVRNGKGKQVCFALINELVSIAPVYYSIGNHELKMDDREIFLNKLMEMGVHVLINESCDVRLSTGHIRLIGLSLPEEYYAKFWKERKLSLSALEELIGKSKSGEYQIMLAHDPTYFKTYAQWGANLVLSGHIHGGIMITPFGGVIAPSLRLFPTYTHGLYQSGKSDMFLTKGLGTHHIKLRFFNIPEVVFLEFKTNHNVSD